MPPETKPVISSLAEMTCENCVYSNISKTPTDGSYCFFHTDWQKSDVGDFCSKGKWMVYVSYDLELMDEKETHPSNYDNCYYLFKDAKCNT